MQNFEINKLLYKSEKCKINKHIDFVEKIIKDKNNAVHTYRYKDNIKRFQQPTT